MKKVGMLTYHNTFNAGASLQTYAVQEMIKRKFADVEVINYTPLTGFLKEYRARIVTRKPFSGIKSILDKKGWVKEYLKLSEKSLISNDYAKASTMLEGYEALFVGSDTVFEIRPKGKAFAPVQPNIYYLPEHVNAKKYSIAASADKSDFSLLDSNQLSAMRKSLQSMEKVSVRDRFTQDFVRSISDVEADLVFDPTFSIDFPKTGIDKTLEDFSRFAVLNVSNRNLGRIVAADMKKRGLLVVSPIRSDFSDVNLIGKLNPMEWAELYRFAEFAVTDRFHGTIFSFKHGCPVLSVDDAVEYRDQVSKKSDMLTRLGLDIVLVGYDEVQGMTDVKASKRIDRLLGDWDKEFVAEKIAVARTRNNEFMDGLNIE